MQSRVELRKTIPYVLGYICPNCDCPILLSIEIDIETAASYAFVETSGKEKAKNNASVLENEAIEAIKMSYQNKKTIQVERNGVWHSWLIRGILCSCPHCGKHAPWQSEDLQDISEKEMERLEKKHFPTIFTSVKEASEWGEKTMLSLIKKENEDEQTEKNTKHLKQDAVMTHFLLEKLQFEKDHLFDDEEYCLWKQKHQELCDLLNQVGFFDFKNKKLLKSRKADVKRNLDEISFEIYRTKMIIEDAIRDKKVDLQRAQSMAYGCSGEYEIGYDDYFGNAFFMAQPNEIPIDDLERYRDDVKVLELYFEIVKPNKKKETSMTDNGKKITYCHKCGFELLDGSVFCSNCGTQLVNKED